MNYAELLEVYTQHLLKCIKYLEYSYDKVKNLPTNIDVLSLDQQATWDSFLARFTRTCSIFFAKFLRTRILQSDPGFKGTFRDLLNAASKLQIIDDPSLWLEIRALRNQYAHEYSEQKLNLIYQASLDHVESVINLKRIL